MKNFYSVLLLACLVGAIYCDCVTFYTDYNQGGNSFSMCSSGDVPSQYNDQISSFVVPRGLQVRLHADYGFSGEYYGPYSPGTYNVDSSFNDAVSSVSIFPVNYGNPSCPAFYADYGLSGDSFQQCQTGNVPNGWNDRISSFIVPAGFQIQLFGDYGENGANRGPYSEGIWNVPANLNDQTSSLLISNYNSNKGGNNQINVRCPTFYTKAGQQGSSFYLCSSDNVPSDFNDRVSSFVIPSGYSVQLFPDYNYGGTYWGPYTQGVYDVPSQFDDQLSSVKISTSSNDGANNWNGGGRRGGYRGNGRNGGRN